MKQVRFVIPSYRSRHTIGRTLDSILGQQTVHSFEVVVVDSSCDDCANWIGSRYPGVEVIAEDDQLSPAAARNRGVQNSENELLAFVDADAQLEPDWLEVLEAELNRPGTHLVGGYVSNANPESQASRILHWIEFSQFLPGPSRWLPAISSSNLLVRRIDFEAVGGFDPTWSMAEDLLFCKRMGSGIRFCGQTGINHLHRDRWDAVAQHLQQLGYWSGRLRAAGAVRGAWLRRIPPLSVLLVPWRSSQILLRVFRTGSRNGLQCLCDFPPLLRGLSCWQGGFRRGLRVRSDGAA